MLGRPGERVGQRRVGRDVGPAGGEDFVADRVRVDLRARIRLQQRGHGGFGAGVLGGQRAGREIDAVLQFVAPHEYERAGAARIAVEYDRARVRVRVMTAARRADADRPAVAAGQPHLRAEGRRLSRDRVRAHQQHAAAEPLHDAPEHARALRVRAAFGVGGMGEANAARRNAALDRVDDAVDPLDDVAFRVRLVQYLAGVVQQHFAMAAEQHLEVVQQPVPLRDVANVREIVETAAPDHAGQAEPFFHRGAAQQCRRLVHDADPAQVRERSVDRADGQVEPFQFTQAALFGADFLVRDFHAVRRRVAEEADRLARAAVEYRFVEPRADERAEMVGGIDGARGIARDVQLAAGDRQLAERRLLVSGRHVAVHAGQVGQSAVCADGVRMHRVDGALPQVRQLRGRAFVRVPRGQDHHALAGVRRIRQQREAVRIDRPAVGAEQRAVGLRVGMDDRETVGFIHRHEAASPEPQRVERRRRGRRGRSADRPHRADARRRDCRDRRRSGPRTH